ncbi:MAG: chloride channel protein [Gammaproteobacteria bacterium]|nr:chloride channel protein [Gammaproteobacteria bacterium]
MRRALKAVWSRLKSAQDVVEDGGLALVDARSLPEHVRIAAIALIVGMLAGGAAILFRLVLEGVQFGFFGFSHGSILELARSLPWWHVMLAPALGGLAIGWFVHVLAYERRTHGVPDVIIASLVERGKLPPKATVGAALINAASAGVGASVGREGPMVHLGASVGSLVGQRLHLSAYDTKTLLGCGVAAGIAASFNVPVAGTIFAFEVVLKRYSFQRLAPVVIAAVAGTAVSRLYYGDFPAWHVPERVFVSYWEFPAFAVLGLVCAVAAFLLMRSVELASHFMDRSPIPRAMRPAVAGLGVGAIAVFLPEVLGVGYEATDAALQESLPLAILIAIVAAKIVATGLSLGSGFGGGHLFSVAGGGCNDRRCLRHRGDGGNARTLFRSRRLHDRGNGRGGRGSTRCPFPGDTYHIRDDRELLAGPCRDAGNGDLGDPRERRAANRLFQLATQAAGHRPQGSYSANRSRRYFGTLVSAPRRADGVCQGRITGDCRCLCGGACPRAVGRG